MKVLFVVPECAPFVRIGELSDVTGALPNEIARMGADARVIMPLYQGIPEHWRKKMKPLASFYVNLGWRRQHCGIESLTHNGVTYYFVETSFISLGSMYLTIKTGTTASASLFSAAACWRLCRLSDLCRM